MNMLYKSETRNTHIYCMLNNMNCPTFTYKIEPPIYIYAEKNDVPMEKVNNETYL